MSQHLVEYSPDQLKLIKETIAKGATDDELKLFLYRARVLGLDPLKPGQLYFMKFGNGPGSIVVGIDGFRSKASQTSKHVGTKRGVLRDDDGRCIGGWAEVYRSDWVQPAREEVSMAEYNTGRGQWLKMPETMIKKVAEAAALRMAFPDDLGGVYTKEEMEQAEPLIHTQIAPPQKELPVEPVKPTSTVSEPAPRKDPGLYRIKIGKFHNSVIREIDPSQLIEYFAWLQEEKKTKRLTGFLKEADYYIEAYFAGKKVEAPPAETV